MQIKINMFSLCASNIATVNNTIKSVYVIHINLVNHKSNS